MFALFQDGRLNRISSVLFLDCGVLMPCFHLISELGSGNALTLGENWCEFVQVEA